MLNRQRIQFYIEYLNSLNRDCCAVEIGVFRGDFLFSVVKYCKQVFWYGIDPFIPFEGYSSTWNRPGKRWVKNNWDSTYKILMQNIEACDDKNRIKLIRKTSVDALSDVPNDLDFVYIDGDHSYEAVLKDITIWEPKVRNGGMIAGNDYTKDPFFSDSKRNLFIGIVKAVDEYAETHNRPLKTDVLGEWYWLKS